MALLGSCVIHSLYSHGVVRARVDCPVQLRKCENFIICACAVPNMTIKTGPAKTGPAGPLATAMLLQVSFAHGNGSYYDVEFASSSTTVEIFRCFLSKFHSYGEIFLCSLFGAAAKLLFTLIPT